MVNLNTHPLVKQAYELCLKIEELPASTEQTALITQASDLTQKIENYFLKHQEPKLPDDFRKLLQNKILHTFNCRVCSDNYLHDKGAVWLKLQSCPEYDRLDQLIRDYGSDGQQSSGTTSGRNI